MIAHGDVQPSLLRKTIPAAPSPNRAAETNIAMLGSANAQAKSSE